MRTRSLLRPRVGAVLALIDPALWGGVEAIHDFRVAARSLRAALRTLARKRRGIVEKTRRALQRATRCLADARDRDVGRSLLAKRPAPTPEAAALRRRLTGLSESERRLGLARAATLWPAGLDRRLIDLLEQGEASVDIVIRRTRAEAWQQRRRAIETLKALGRRYDPVRLHELRRRVRSLRYAIEVLAEVDSGAQARVIQLKPLQSALGDIQDRIVLSRWLAEAASRFRRSDPVLARVLRIEAAEHRAQSMNAHATFLQLKPARVLERLALHVDAHSEPARPRPMSATGPASRAKSARRPSATPRRGAPTPG